MDMEELDLFPAGKLAITLRRLSHELIEEYGNFDQTVILGIQTTGVALAQRLRSILHELVAGTDIPLGMLDATFYRDDFRKRATPLQPNRTQVDFLIEDQKVILVDDVLYTGRTVRAAMDAMLAFGRPKSVELLTLVDRRHQRELPVEARYIGITVDTIESQRVIVELSEVAGTDRVYLASQSA